jgi:hypothetical protein
VLDSFVGILCLDNFQFDVVRWLDFDSMVCQLIDLLQQLQQRKTKLYDIGAMPK